MKNDIYVMRDTSDKKRLSTNIIVINIKFHRIEWKLKHRPRNSNTQWILFNIYLFYHKFDLPFAYYK